MAKQTCRLGFGETFDTVAARTAGGQPLNLNYHRSGEVGQPHSHTNDYLCVVLAGGFAEQQRGSWREWHAGSYFTHQAGETHHDRFGPHGAICLSLHYGPRQSAPEMAGVCPASAKVAADTLAFELAANSRDELVMASLAGEITAGLCEPEDTASDGAAWINRVMEAIADEPRRRWHLHELARIADRHPIRLAQVFRERTGISIGAFQRLRRLTNVSLALRHGETPLAVLAAEYGYFDQSHLTLEFRRAFGISPGRYRKQH